jgi:hypothetical protein
MEEILNHMIKNEENIQPPWIKFLLDSKETIKLLMRKETDGEINIYKQLAHLGIDARFSRLEGIRNTKIITPSFTKGERVEKAGAFVPAEKKSETIPAAEKKIEDISNKMNLFMDQPPQPLKKFDEISRNLPGFLETSGLTAHCRGLAD